MKLQIIFLIVLLSLGTVHADLGFIHRWESSPGGNIKTIAAMDYNRDRDIAEILAGSTDNKVYLFDKNGNLISTYISEGNIYAVDAFDWAKDVSSLSFRKNLPVAGSWDNFVYAFYPWSGVNYFSNSNLYWKYDAGEDIYSISAVDLNGTGYDNYIMVGVGNHLTNKGKVVVLNMNGTKSWELSTSCAPNSYSSVDLDHDGDMTEVVIGYCNTVDVRNYAGTSAWSYSTNGTVSAIHHADFDDDGEYDDVLAAAGTKLYAINNRGGLLWTFETNGTVHSISKMGRGSDLEYHLIGSGTKILAFTGSEQKGSVLWSYESGINLTSHTMIDFDGDGKLDDIILTDGQKVYAYEFSIIFPPKLEITKTVSTQNATLGQNLEVELVLKNTGYGRAEDISVVDQIPDGLKLIKGETTWEINLLEPFKKKSIVYIINASKVGNYTLPSAEVTYSDKYGVRYALKTNDKTINVTEQTILNGSVDNQLLNNSANGSIIRTLNLTTDGNSSLNVSNVSLNDSIVILSSNTSNNETSSNTTFIQDELNMTLGPPQLSVVRSVSKKILKVGENTTVDIVLSNFGESSAVEIVCEEVIPEEIEILGIKPLCPDNLKPGKSDILSYTIIIGAGPIKDKSRIINFTPLAVTYKDTSTDQILQTKSDMLTISIEKESPDWKERLLEILPVLVVASVALGILYKKKKLDIKKIKLPSKITSILGTFKNKIPRKSEVSPDMGKKFMKIYLEYYRKGTPPTYADMREELGVDYKEIEKIAKTVKKKLKR